MDDLEKFNETPEKADFYSHLNMEDITDDVLAKRVSKDFNIMICMFKATHYC